jgi:hypothetical protein
MGRVSYGGKRIFGKHGAMRKKEGVPVRGK